jgi:hypothetical protein
MDTPFLKGLAQGKVIAGPIVRDDASGIETQFEYEAFITANSGPAEVGDAVLSATGHMIAAPRIQWNRDVEVDYSSTAIEANPIPHQTIQVTVASILATTATLNFVRGANPAAESIIIFVKPADPNNLTPTQGVALANAATIGTVVVWKIVDGTTATVALTSLTAATVYHVQAFESNDDEIITDADIRYNIAAAFINPTFFTTAVS